MMKSRANPRLETLSDDLVVAPDVALLPVTVRQKADTASAALTKLRQVVSGLQKKAGEAVTIVTQKFSSHEESAASKTVFGRQRSYRVESTLMVMLPLAGELDYWARVEKVEALRAALDDGEGDAVRVGPPEYQVEHREAHFAAAVARIHSRAHAAAAELGMVVEQLELSPAIQVHVVGPAEARVRIEVTATFRRS